MWINCNYSMSRVEFSFPISNYETYNGQQNIFHQQFIFKFILFSNCFEQCICSYYECNSVWSFTHKWKIRKQTVVILSLTFLQHLFFFRTRFSSHINKNWRFKYLFIITSNHASVNAFFYLSTFLITSLINQAFKSSCHVKKIFENNNYINRKVL